MGKPLTEITQLTTVPVSTVTAASGMGELFLMSTSAPSAKQEYCADISGAQGPVDLIVDVSSANVDITVTVKGGDGPTARKDRTYTVAGDTCQCIPVSTGETIRSDGKFYFTLTTAGTTFSALGARVAVIKRQNVETH